MSAGAEARRQIIEPLLAQNRTVNEIARHLSDVGQLRGVSVRTIAKDVELIQTEWKRRANRDPEMLKAEALAKLDLLERAVLPNALMGDEKCTWFIDRALEIAKRRAALLGQDSPTKVQKQVVTEDVVDAEIKRLAGQLNDRGESGEAPEAKGSPKGRSRS